MNLKLPSKMCHTHTKKSTKNKLHFFLAPGESSASALGVGVEVAPLSPLNTINMLLLLTHEASIEGFLVGDKQ